ncbi:MAG: methyltransferase [Kiritimatiellae bacterium]|nr:methyltransferase [Kiritimatiellia bacterium]
MKADKDLYRQLRGLSCEKLWKEEVPLFDGSTPGERGRRVAVIRAVGVVMARSGSAQQKAEVRAWLARLLRDPSEKVRRYAMAALPKLGVGPKEEAELLALLRTTTSEREKKFLGQALDKIGGTATLDVVAGERGLLPQTEQKVRARVARSQGPSVIRMDRALARFGRLRIHLRCRKGLEAMVRDEFEERIGRRGKFRLMEVGRRFVAITPLAPFCLADLYALRCFAAVSFVLGTVRNPDLAESVDALAALITSPLSRQILAAFTEGAIRYRLEFVSKGHQRGAIRLLANRAYAMCPDLLNDARKAPWSVDIHPIARGLSVELRPRLAPDPRFTYRQDDIPAASHPPLAACMARLAGRARDEIVWDPFCGSGLELVERARLGGVRRVFGTDLSPAAIDVARANVAAAKLESVQATFACCDFRNFAKVEGLGPDSVTLILTNPPMGRRIRISNLRGLFEDLFSVAAAALKPGGRLVFANPLRIEPREPSLKLQFRQAIDLGGFECRLEVYLKSSP